MAFKGLMARGERIQDESGEFTTERPERVRREVTPSTCVDASSELEGVLRCRETVRVAGRLKGELHCEQSVIVAPGACIEAAIHADSVFISGEVKGDIAARKKITLDRSARVTGDLTTPGIVIEEGAKLEGRILIGCDEAADAEKAAAKKETAKEAAARSATRAGRAAPSAPTADAPPSAAASA
jgi:cytoskeletal protein CcmA (bactofilin family)